MGVRLIGWVAAAYAAAMAFSGAAQPQPGEFTDAELGQWVAFWVNYAEGDERADINGDGQINSADFSALLAGWQGDGTGDGGDDSGGDGDDGGGDGDDDTGDDGSAGGEGSAAARAVDAYGYDVAALIGSGDYRVVYLDADGDDDNDGSSPAEAVSSFSRATRIVAGFDGPRAILIDSADEISIDSQSWDWMKGTRERPAIFSAYPVGEMGTVTQYKKDNGNYESAALSMLGRGKSRTVEHGVFANLDLVPVSYDVGVVAWKVVADPWYMTAQNMRVVGWRDGIVWDCSGNDPDSGERARGLALLGSIVSNNGSARGVDGNDSSAHRKRSQGVYLAGIDGWIVAGNTLHRNGYASWRDGESRRSASLYSHNLYGQYSCDDRPDIGLPIVYRWNWSSYASATGAQLRAGGEMTDNVFWSDPIAGFVGSVDAARGTNGNGVDMGVDGKCRAIIAGNLVAEMTDISDLDGQSRGWGLHIEVVDEPSRMSGNMVANAVGGGNQSHAYIVDCYGKSSGRFGIGDADVEISDNVAHGTKSFFLLDNGLDGDTLGRVRFSGNRFDDAVNEHNEPGPVAGVRSVARQYRRGVPALVEWGGGNDSGLDWNPPTMLELYPDLLDRLNRGERAPDPAETIRLYRETLN